MSGSSNTLLNADGVTRQVRAQCKIISAVLVLLNLLEDLSWIPPLLYRALPQRYFGATSVLARRVSVLALTNLGQFHCQT